MSLRLAGSVTDVASHGKFQCFEAAQLVAVRAVEIRPEHYYNAALQRFADVKLLRAAGMAESPLAAYLCGVSVECALRSLIPPATMFYDRHDFLVLARLGALTGADDAAFSRIGVLLNEVRPLWRNSLRFYSDDLFVAFCRRRARSSGLPVHRRTRSTGIVCLRLYEISERMLIECEQLWRKKYLNNP